MTTALERLIENLDDAAMEIDEVIAGRPDSRGGLLSVRTEPESCRNHIRKALELARAYQKGAN